MKRFAAPAVHPLLVGGRLRSRRGLFQILVGIDIHLLAGDGRVRLLFLLLLRSKQQGPDQGRHGNHTCRDTQGNLGSLGQIAAVGVVLFLGERFARQADRGSCGGILLKQAKKARPCEQRNDTPRTTCTSVFYWLDLFHLHRMTIDVPELLPRLPPLFLPRQAFLA